MHSVLMMKGDKLFCECYFAPFHKDLNHRMYSQTKSFVSIAIGFLIDEGKLKLDDKIADFFPEKIDRELPENIKAQTVRNMLMMSTVGYGEPWFDNKDRDRVHLYFNAKRNLLLDFFLYSKLLLKLQFELWKYKNKRFFHYFVLGFHEQLFCKIQ